MITYKINIHRLYLTKILSSYLHLQLSHEAFGITHCSLPFNILYYLLFMRCFVQKGYIHRWSWLSSPGKEMMDVVWKSALVNCMCMINNNYCALCIALCSTMHMLFILLWYLIIQQHALHMLHTVIIVTGYARITYTLCMHVSCSPVITHFLHS